MALEMKTECETCARPLSMESEACICSYECTFCPPCTQDKHKHVCPNCGGELVTRPVRKAEA